MYGPAALDITGEAVDCPVFCPAGDLEAVGTALDSAAAVEDADHGGPVRDYIMMNDREPDVQAPFAIAARWD